MKRPSIPIDKIDIDAETRIDNKSMRRSSMKGRFTCDGSRLGVGSESSIRLESDRLTFKRIRFDKMVLICETEDLTQTRTSWGDVWADLYYDQDQLAEFKYEAFCAECENEDENWMS